jgi:hypothetical protein
MKMQFSGFTKRVGVSKGLGFLLGLIGFCMLPYVWPNADLMLRWGILLWYTTFGAIIGVFGVIDRGISFKFPAYFSGILIGAWLNFVLVFFAYEKMSEMLRQLRFMEMSSPWWFVLEGALIGLLIDLVATKYGGEGKDIL